jgi:hypothetical protein
MEKLMADLGSKVTKAQFRAWYLEERAKRERIATVISKLAPEDLRANVGLSVNSLKALQRMVASQASGGTIE